MSNCSVMLKTPIRPKRSLEYGDGCSNVDENFNNSRFVPSHKKMCVKSVADPSSLASNRFSPPPQASSGLNFPSSKGKNTEDESDENMDVSDDIVSTFNTISFDSSLNENGPINPRTLVTDSSTTLHKTCVSPPSSTSSKTYPVFPPLVRSGRKIDHLVDDVIRKSSRYNAGSFQLSIPSSDFEFYMPSNVSVTGNPTTDARFISSPENRNLAVSAMRNVMAAPSMRETQLIQFGDSAANFSEHHYQKEENVNEDSSHDVPSLHLGSVTHSEWFENSSSSSSSSSSMCNSDSEIVLSDYNSDVEQYPGEYDNDDKDEDCDDMFIES